MSSSLNLDGGPHSAGSSTRVSFNTLPPVIDQPKAGALPPTSPGSESDEERKPAVGAVSLRGEHLQSPKDEKEEQQEKGDPFLVVWDETDKENPRVCSRRVRDPSHVFSDPQPLLEVVDCISLVPVRLGQHPQDSPLISLSPFAAERPPLPSWSSMSALLRLLPLGSPAT